MAVAVLDCDDAAAQAVAAEIGGLAVTADVTSPEAVERAVEATLARFERGSTCWSTTPASPGRGPRLQMPLDTLQAMLRVNVEGVFIASRAVLPHMIARRSGSIVNLASWAGKTGAAYFVGYSATKFAVIGLTQALAREMAPHGIRVNSVICPGIVDTAMRTALESPAAPLGAARNGGAGKAMAMGRVSVPDDVAGAAAFLASDAAAYITVNRSTSPAAC